MASVHINPTRLDRWIAKAVSREADPRIETAAETLTWGADEHILLPAASVLWIASRASDSEAERRIGSHLLATAIVTAILPHLLKTAVDQERPDRKSFAAHRRGIPYSGKRNDAFPSGHAVHMGALASAATLFPRRYRNTIWVVTALLSATRIAVLAHWTTDVVIGAAVGAGVERAIRKFTLRR